MKTTVLCFQTFLDTNIIRMARITRMPHLFLMKHIFRSEYGFLIYTEKRKEEKNLNSNSQLGDTKFNE